MKDVPCTTELAANISKALKKRGFKFVGPTMVYAFMQAAGFVNDHTVDCFRWVLEIFAAACFGTCFNAQDTGVHAVVKSLVEWGMLGNTIP